MKKVMLMLFLLFPLLIMAQGMPFAVQTSTRYGSSSTFGVVEGDSVKYYQARLIQEFNYAKFGLGLDLDFLFDEDYRLKEEDWDNLGDVFRKIYYFNYASPADPVYFHLGGFPVRSMGNGLVMLNYSNMRFYPDQRNTGLLIGASPKIFLKPSFEVFSSNLEKNQILSFSTKFHPLPDSSLGFINKSILGFSLVMDRNQKGNLKHTLGDSLYQVTDKGNASPAAVLSVDFSVPVVKTSDATYGVYAELAHIVDNGTGFILPGIYGNFKYVKINLEYRQYGKRFVPAFFDSFYEEERAELITFEDSTQAIVTKEDMLREVKPSYGFFGKVQGMLGKKVRTTLTWQNMYGDELKTGKSLWFSMYVDTQYKRLENMSFSYAKTNVEKLSLGKVAVPRAQLSAHVTLSLNAKRKWFFNLGYSERYKDKEGEIKWWKDTKRSASVGVKYTY